MIRSAQLTLLLLARSLCVDERGHLQHQWLQGLFHGHGADLQVLGIPLHRQRAEFRHFDAGRSLFCNLQHNGMGVIRPSDRRVPVADES